MTPQEKAKELVNKFQSQIFYHVTDNKIDIEESKACALIAVDEIINEFYTHPVAKIYWQEVKKEIEKL
jgi:hypothetical protein